MKIVFFGTSENSVMLLEGIQSHFEVIGIVTTPDSKVGRKQILTPSLVAQFATNSEVLKNVPIFKPSKLKDDEFLHSLKKLGAELFIVLSYGKILPKEVIDLPPLKTINIHPSLLPLYRGATPMPSALLDGATVTGNTIIVMDEEMDHGPILAQKEMAIDSDDTYVELEKKLALDSVGMVLETVPLYATGKATLREQDHDKATYTKMVTKEDGKIDWNKTAEEIYNQYRAFARWPGIWTTWDGEVLKIVSCYPAKNLTGPSIANIAPGTVLENGFVVCGNDTLLELRNLQKAGKTATDTKSFLNGNKSFPGAILK